MDLLIPDISVWEKIARSAAVYFFLLLALRLTGKRQVGQLTPFDLVVLLVISNVLQNAAIGNDNSLGGGMIGATVILVLNWAIAAATYRSKRMRRFIEASPTVLIHNGRVLHANLQNERVTMEELRASLRRNGVVHPSEVRFAVLEENGAVSVIPYEHRQDDTTATKA